MKTTLARGFPVWWDILQLGYLKDFVADTKTLFHLPKVYIVSSSQSLVSFWLKNDRKRAWYSWQQQSPCLGYPLVISQ